jgi:hypothetical protein
MGQHVVKEAAASSDKQWLLSAAKQTARRPPVAAAVDEFVGPGIVRVARQHDRVGALHIQNLEQLHAGAAAAGTGTDVVAR